MTQTDHTVLITGATGRQGGSVVRHMLAVQAKRGETIFTDKCATCHDGNGFGPVLLDDSFWSAWSGRVARTLYSSIIKFDASDGSSKSLGEECRLPIQDAR